MKITLAFEKDGSGFYNTLIKLWTKSDYSHVEIIIKDKWISSDSSRGGVYINDLRPLSDKWHYIDIEVDGRKLSRVMKFLKSQENSDYDWLGVFFGGGFDILIEDKTKWYCSEMCSRILYEFDEPTISGIYEQDDLSILSPEDLRQLYE